LIVVVILTIIIISTFVTRPIHAMASPSSRYRGALIFLHGLGDTPLGWSDLERMLPQYSSRLSSIKYVFPPAPTIPITINGGAKMPGW
jgi:lysophospholipase-2